MSNMQWYSGRVRIEGDTRFVYRVPTVSAAEVTLLRHIHGYDAVVDLEPVEVNGRLSGLTVRQEKARLSRKYMDITTVEEVFPGAEPRMPEAVNMARDDDPAMDEVLDDLIDL